MSKDHYNNKDFPLTVNVQLKGYNKKKLETQIVPESDAPFQLKAVKALFLQVLQASTLLIYWMLQEPEYMAFDFD